MAYLFHNSNTDGTIKDEVVSGQLGALFTSVTTGERLAGNTENSKVFITADETTTTYVGINAYNSYNQCVFMSASDSDQESDLTGAELKYGALEITAATNTEITVNEDSIYTLARVGDTMAVDDAPYEIATIVDNLDGTLTITATIIFTTIPAIGSYVTTLFTMPTVQNVPLSFWRQRIVAAGSTWSGSDVVVDLLVGK